MSKKLLILLLWGGYICSSSAEKNLRDFRAQSQTEDTLPKFKPHVQVGGFVQVQGVATQDRPADPAMDNTRQWAKQAQLWRARFMVGGVVSRKTSFFMQTELPSRLGW